MGSSKYVRVLWRHLPPEVLEYVLACLPLHVLCRLRLVCRDWNRLICAPEFASLRTRIPRTPSCILLVPRMVRSLAASRYHSPPSTISWTVLDASEKRFYQVPVSPSLSAVDRSFWQHGGCKYTLASDGGLLYIMYSATSATSSPQRHVVCNLVNESFHEIPGPELCSSYNRATVVMSVDHLGSRRQSPGGPAAYRLVTVVDPPLRCRGAQSSSASSSSTAESLAPQLFVFESGASTWRKIPVEQDSSSRRRVLSSVFWNGVLYTLLLPMRGGSRIPTLHVWEGATIVWRKVKVKLPVLSHRQNMAVLAVSANRLFMVEYTELKKPGTEEEVSLRVWELVLEPGWKAVVQPLGYLQQFSEYSLYMLKQARASDDHLEPAVAVVGCSDDDALVVSCITGNRVRFDLRKRLWINLPSCELLGRDYHDMVNCNYYMDSAIGRCYGICAGLVDFGQRLVTE